MIKYIRQIIIAFLENKADKSYFTNYIIKNSIQLFLLQCFSLVLGFLSNYVLIKIAGVSVYGSYIYLFNFLYLLVGFCLLGMDTLLVKKIPIYEAEENNGKLKGIIFFAFAVCLTGSLIVAGVAAKIIGLTNFITVDIRLNWFILSLSTLLMLSVITINQSSLQGLKKIILSQAGDKIIRPALIIAFATILFFSTGHVDLPDLVWINMAVLGITLLVTFILLQKNLPGRLKLIKPQYDIISWTNSALAFFLLGVLYLVNSRVDIFLLGLFRGKEEVGVYNIALKISEIVSFGLIIVNFIIAPVIAGLFEKRDLLQLQRLVTQAARMVVIIGAPLLLLIVFFSRGIMIFFGVNIFEGRQALLILCAGQLINILCGSVGTLLLMSGYQRFSIYSLAISTAFSIIVNIILTPKYGLVGTAISTAISVAMWNCLMYFFVRKKINIRPTAFGVV